MSRHFRVLRHAAIIALLAALALLLSACRPIIEEGWIPGADGRPEWASYEIVGDEAIIQDDMFFILSELREFQADLPESPEELVNVPLAAVYGRGWPDGVLVYDESSIDAFDGICQWFDKEAHDLNGNDQWDAGEACSYTQAQAIRDGMDLLETNTEARFRPVQPLEFVHHIRFERDSRCRAEVGYKGNWSLHSTQYVKLAPTCGAGHVAHELGHSMGFKHEQARPDRDSYVEIFWQNIMKDKDRQFEKAGKAWGQYDFRSIMHYDPYAWSKNGEPTIGARFDLPARIIGYTPGPNGVLSKGDVAAWNAMVARGRTGFLPSDDRSLFDDAGDFPDAGPVPAEVVTADIDADGTPDLVGFVMGSSGEVLYASGLGDGTFGSTYRVHEGFCLGTAATCGVGDVDGDGSSDLVSFDPMAGHLFVAPSWGNAFGDTQLWQVTGSMPLAELRLADVNGDCRQDAVLLEWNDASGTVEAHVALSTGRGFTAPVSWGVFAGVEVPGLADLDADGADDLVLADANGDVRVHSAALDGFVPADHDWVYGFCPEGTRCRLADLDADGLPDLVAERPFVDLANEVDHYLNRLRVAVNLGQNFTVHSPYFHEMDCRSERGCLYADADGDGRMDVIEVLASAKIGTEGTRVYVSRNNAFLQDANVENVLKTGVASPGCTAAPPPPDTGLWEPNASFGVARVIGTYDTTFAVSAGTGDLYRHEGGMGWADNGPAQRDLAATDHDLYRLRSDGELVTRRTGDGGWYGIAIGGGAVALHGGTTGLFATNAWGELKAHKCFCGRVQRYGWRTIGTAGWQVAVGGIVTPPGDDVGAIGTLYKLDAQGPWSFDFATETWTRIGGPAAAIFAGGSRFYATNPSTGNLYSWDRWANRWTYVSPGAAQFAISPQSGKIVKLASDTGSIWQYTGSGTSWVQIGGPADEIWVASGFAWARNGANGELSSIPLF